MYTTKVDDRWPTCAAVAREVGRSRGVVERVVEEAGLARRGKKTRVTVAERDRIVALYRTKAGDRWMSTPRIARLVGRPAATVQRVLAQAGVALRPVAEALRVQVPEELRVRIIQLYSRSGWSYPRVAAHLGVSKDITYMVLDEAGVMVRSRHSKVRAGEGDLLVALYRQGRSCREVAELTGRSAAVVRRLARKAGVLRQNTDSAGLANTRRATRTRLTRMDLRPYARRWMDGTEPEDLAAELAVPADLLWDALAEVLAVMAPDYRTDCHTGRCLFGCVAICAATATVGTTKTGRLY